MDSIQSKSELAGGPLLKEGEAAQILGFSVRALQNWRLRGGGPLFVKIGQGSVRYRASDLKAWIGSNLRANSSEPQKHSDRSRPLAAS